ncbi:UBP-type zinc finger domain-containing protein [Smaragdicoccus niigatensis]|uniref:UBP-type zinc finger domain-containing protein n=1 Tax=Smaragdicoccus niigatensis TaxID=359359 RepID=UPI000475B275|nr:UBP-type zinc finger domain-containing protein [Smaragdicoccus niigatensis]
MGSADHVIDVTVPPSGPGCAECDAANGWWVHLRRCALCGHVGCCDSSPGQHASGHFAETGHPIVQSYEPGESWFWDYARLDYYDGPTLTPPDSHPLDQPTPGPRGRVPQDWRSKVR